MVGMIDPKAGISYEPSDPRSNYMTPEMVKRLYEYAKALQNTPTSQGGGQFPVITNPWQGASNVVNALVGGYEAYRAGQGERGSTQTDAGWYTRNLPKPPAGGPKSDPGIYGENAPAAPKPAIPAGALNFAPQDGGNDTNRQAAIERAVDTALPQIIKLESGGNPNARTGSYTGELQMGPDEIAKYGGNDVASGRRLLIDRATQLANQLGRVPTGAEIYLAHQQGMGGFQAHNANPDAPAWQNMAATKEGRDKGPNWAKQAIWGNIPDTMKAQFGSVDNVTSRDFMNLWSQKMGATPPPVQDAGSPAPGSMALAFNGKYPPIGGAPSPKTGATPAQAIPGAAGPINGVNIPPGVIPPASTYDTRALTNILSSGWLDPSIKANALNMYMGTQVNPRTIPYLGGQVVVPPPGAGGAPWFAPGVHWGNIKAPGGAEVPSAEMVVPGRRGQPEMRTLTPELPNQAPPPPSNAAPPPAITPDMLRGGAAPPAPPAASPQRGDIPAGGPALALNQPPGVASDAGPIGVPPTAAPKAPAIAETPEAAVAQAQKAVAPPPPLQGGPNVAQGAPPPTGGIGPLATRPPETQVAGNILQDLQKMGIDYEQRKELAHQDAQQYTKNLQQYSDIGRRATLALPPLKLAEKMVQDPRFYSGPMADFYENLQRWRANLTGNKAAAAPMEVFSKILSGEVVTELKTLLGGLGQIRLAEINLINNSVANKYNTPTANLAVLQIMQRAQAQAAMMGRIATAYGQGWRWDESGQPHLTGEAPTNAGLQKTIQQYVDKNPLFSDAELQNYNQTLQMGKPTPNPKWDAAKQKELYEAAHIEPPAAQAEPGAPAAAGKIIRYDQNGKRIVQ